MIRIRFTGLNELKGRFDHAPAFLEAAVGKALANSIAMVETESKRLTPVDTGLLRSSIGGEQGYSYIRGLTAGVGTNVKYAIYVELDERARHSIGQAHFMEGGAQNAESYIVKEFEGAMIALAEKLAS